MNSKEKNLALLPNGFVDLLTPEAESEAKAIAKLMKLFSQFAFNRVKPPIVEFEESLFAPGPGRALIDTTFRLMDPLSHRMMAVRSDITPQISRIARYLLKDSPRPLRLMYANDVLRTRASQQRTERQFTKAGCEIVGTDSLQADVEIAVIAAYGLISLGVSDVTLDFACPRLVQGLLQQYDVQEEVQFFVFDALSQRSLDIRPDILKKLPAELKKDLSVLIKASTEISGNVFSALEKITWSESLQPVLTDLKEVFSGVEMALKDLGVSNNVTLSVDPVETQGFEYHSGVAFSLFCNNARGELGRGGRYVCGDEGGEGACGFTLYMDTVRSAMPEEEKVKRIFVPYDMEWCDIVALQKEGWRVERAVEKEQSYQRECTHVWDDGEIKTL